MSSVTTLDTPPPAARHKYIHHYISSRPNTFALESPFISSIDQTLSGSGWRQNPVYWSHVGPNLAPFAGALLTTLMKCRVDTGRVNGDWRSRASASTIARLSITFTFHANQTWPPSWPRSRYYSLRGESGYELRLRSHVR